MKALRFAWWIVVILMLVPASPQWARGDDGLLMIPSGGSGLLGRPSQLIDLYLDRTTGDWIQVMPDDSSQIFNWGNGKYFVMNCIAVRFYADTPNTPPYRIFFKAPNGTKMWVENLPNCYYPTTGSTVWGGANIVSYNPGIVMSVKPAVEVHQIPVPPNDPLTGPLIPGAIYMRMTGYVVP